MFLRAIPVTALMVGLSVGLLGSPSAALAQLLPPLPPLFAPPRPLPPAAVDNDDNLPPYDPPPGYRRPLPGGPPGQPQRSYESEALPPPGPYGAAPGREPTYAPPPGQGQYGAAPGYPPGREPAYGPPPGQGQYGAAPGYPPGREPAYDPPPGREPAYGPPPGYQQDPRGPAGRPQYGAVPPQQDDSFRPPMGVGPGQGQGDPDVTSRLPMDVRPESGPRKELPAQFRRTTVEYRTREPAGTIIVDTQNTYLYLVLGNGQAIRYGIGVGREGFTWAGAERVTRMAEWPDWHPPPEMIERQPYLPRFMAGGEGNPLGARALYLGKTIYRIHGTNQPSTIGSFVSSGCIRLTNEDVTDLFYRVKVGTRVVVLSGKPPASASGPAPQTVRPPQGQQAENYDEPIPLQPPAVIRSR
jgi:lipoprotein-anchoring transpeptidase ErfK/SrfK